MSKICSLRLKTKNVNTIIEAFSPDNLGQKYWHRLDEFNVIDKWQAKNFDKQDYGERVLVTFEDIGNVRKAVRDITYDVK